MADLSTGSEASQTAALARQDTLTKPRGSLGKLEALAAWLARWQGRAMPRLDRVDVIVFAGSHGVTAQGVSAFPAEVTAQMVANFAAGGAAINQIARAVGATLAVVPLDVETPTVDFTTGPAMDEGSFAAAFSIGYEAVAQDSELICLGEMGIGNTTAAAALATALFGGEATNWVGRGTGVDDAGLARKASAIRRGFAANPQAAGDPLLAAAALGGRELAAILGATLAARHRGVPVLLDGFVSTAAAAPLARLAPGGLDHAQAAHVSAEAGHRGLLAALGKEAILDLGMRLGEGSGAALAVGVLRAALACHLGMASFSEAGVSDREA
ncbi:MAG: nicotinate-nucleotide--dimethylbenzimidazole phosphoribosyltransferase [Rhizobiaceae bacterium]